MGKLEDKFNVVEEDKKKPETPVFKVQQEHEGPMGAIEDIKEKPVKKGICKEMIWGEPLDWHDLEDFVVSISPHKFVTLLKLKDVILRQQLMRYAKKPTALSGKFIIIIILAVILLLGGLLFIMFGPQLLSMFGMG